MTGERQHGRLRNVFVWSGAGLLTGALLWAAVVVTANDGRVLEELGGWWAVSALIALLVLVFGVGWDRGTERNTVPFVFWMCPAIGTGLLMAWFAFPRDSFEATTDGPWSFDPSPAAVQLWLVVCAIALGCLLMLAGWGRADPRPFRRTMPFLGAGAVAVALAGAMVAQFLVPLVPHREADRAGEPEPVPAEVSDFGWTWRPPMDTEIVEVHAGTHGPLVLLRNGAVALDGSDGTEVWSYRRPYDRVSDVWREGGRVHVRHRVGTDDDDDGGGQEHFETAELDAATGELVDEASDALPPPPNWVDEYGREQVDEALSLPENCVVARTAGYGYRLVGVVGCVDEEFTEPAVEAGDPFGWEGAGVEAMIVAVDPEEESELWRTEWSVPAPARAPRLTEAPADTADPPVIVERGPEERTVVLDPDNGSELVALPEGLEESEDHIGLAHADETGTVVAVDTDDLQTTFHRADASGEITDTAVVEEAFLHDTVGSRGIALLDGALVVARTYGHGEEIQVAVLVAPFGETSQWNEESVFQPEARSTDGALAVPGSLVVTMEDDDSQILAGLVP
ncbi:hypothetical protein [Nocardiopsis nanhaiensis]